MANEDTTANGATPLEGGCTCRAVRYRLASGPLYVHCCHCRWCQRETGTAFALNAMIETDRMPPDIHIYTMSKQPWVVLPEGANAVDAFYRSADHWPQESLDRMTAMRAKRAAART